MTTALPIIYEDADIVVVDKPAGILTHQASSNDNDDVYHLLVQQGVDIKTSGDEYRQGIVSRLDIGTSGVLVVAKNDVSFQNLKEQFQNHSVEKTYIALVHGHFAQKSGRIEAPIGRHPNPKKRSLFAVVEGGKPAVTDFDVLREYQLQNVCYTLIKIRLHTGRTHQIRVHLSAYGHPLVGDTQYSTSQPSTITLNRPFLHSQSLKLTHPTSGANLHFRSSFPEDLRDVMEYVIL